MNASVREHEKKIAFFRTGAFFAAVAFALLGAFGAWLEGQVRQIFVEDSEQLAMAIVSATATRVEPLLDADDYDGVVGTLESIVADTGAVDVLVASAEGKVVSHLTRAEEPSGRLVEVGGGRVDLPTQPGAMRQVDGHLQAWVKTDTDPDASWVRITIPLAHKWGRFDVLRDYMRFVAALGGLMLLVLLLSPLAWTYRFVERRESSLLAERDELHYAVYHDRLTGLFNRVGLLEQLQGSLTSRGTSDRLLAVCFLDLDGFKAVNDRYGHAVGDLLLVEVARRLSGCVRQTDTVARLGGDEFVLLLEGEGRPGEL